MTVTRLRCYISGPISKGDLAANINQGTAAFVRLTKQGLSPLCPMWSVYSKECRVVSHMDSEPSVVCTATREGNDQMSHEDWLGVDLSWVEVADCVLRLPGASVGADREVAWAVKNDIPIFFTEAAVIEWKKSLDKLVEDAAAARKQERFPYRPYNPHGVNA